MLSALPSPTPATMSSASPAKLYMPAAEAPGFSHPPPLPLVFGAGDDDSCSCRTPTGSRIAYLREATTCPPAPRKPPPPPPPRGCRKRLFRFQAAAADHQQPAPPEAAAPAPAPGGTLISLRLDDLQRLFRPATTTDKRRRSDGTYASIQA